MKLLKVGSSPSCDIVVNNEYVSSHHADITVLDSGEIFIEDKGSRNGTFVGVNKQRLQPGQEYPIHRGDRVMLGNEPLRWERVPQPNSFPKARRVVNIGSNQRNDIIVPGGVVSRYHATLVIDKDGRAMLIDNKSTNGTKVNGQKIMAGRPTQIKRGDNVIVGEEDITSQLEQYIPGGSGAGKIIGIIAGAVAAVAIICGIVWAVWPKPDIPDSAVVMVRNVYHYNLELADNPYHLPVHMESKRYVSFGTGFFIDKDGHIGTNRHIACPWLEEYQTQDAYTSLKIQDELKQEWDNYLKQNVPTRVNDLEELRQLESTQLGSDIVEACANSSNPLRTLNNMLEKLHNTPVKITGESDLISIAYANRHYTNFDEFAPAVIVAESGNKDKDVAILQLNTKETPEKILKAGIFDMKNINTAKPEIQKDALKFKGYPDGIARTWDEHFKSSTNNPTTYQGKVSRNLDKYTFEIQANTTHGSSGSPVYVDGKLFGLVSGGHAAGDDVIIAKAQWLEELYKNEVLQ